MTARAVFAVNCTLTVSRRVLVDAPADVDGDELRDWITDGDLGDGDFLDPDVVHGPVVCDPPTVVADSDIAGGFRWRSIHVADGDLVYRGEVSTWEELVALRRTIVPDRKAPSVGQFDIFGEEVT